MSPVYRKVFFLAFVLSTVTVSLHAQELSQSGCGISQLSHESVSEGGSVLHGITLIPRAMVRPKNLAWELPIAAATGLLITKADAPLNHRVGSVSYERSAGRISNLGWGVEFASGAIAYGVGCQSGNHYLRDTGFKSLAAMGVAGTADFALKSAFNRQFPYTPGSTGAFWGGGRSFPSGHSATSFAFASVVAHRYPHKAWVKWGAYALATGVSLSRFPSKKHYASDILVGATLGYVTGAYMANH